MKIEIKKIKQLLAHRYPMLLIDGVNDFVVNEYIYAEKKITANDFYYRTSDHHIQGQRMYAYPGTLMLESFCQAACLLGCLTNTRLAGHEYLPLLGSIHQCSLEREAFPGERLEHHVRMAKNLGEAFIFNGDTYIDGELATSVDMVIITFQKGRI